MKTIVLSALLLVAFGFTNASVAKPKVKRKDGVVTVDGEPYLKYDYKQMAQGYDIMNLNGERLFFLRGESYNDPTKISSSNSTGRVSYASLIREGQTEVICEPGSPDPKYMAMLLMEYEALDQNGNIVEANFQRMVTQVGMTYSAKRPTVVR